MSEPPGIEITIPFFAEPLRITRIVSDYTGTLSFHGRPIFRRPRPTGQTSGVCCH